MERKLCSASPRNTEPHNRVDVLQPYNEVAEWGIDSSMSVGQKEPMCRKQRCSVEWLHLLAYLQTKFGLHRSSGSKKSIIYLKTQVREQIAAADVKRGLASWWLVSGRISHGLAPVWSVWRIMS